MNFRCPNCSIVIDIPVRKSDEETVSVDQADDPDVVECPTCHSRFSLSEERSKTVVPDSGLTIGHFEVQSVLGEGGFGVVYKAWDSELDRTVAIKMPQGKHRHTGGGQFLREAKAAASIDHPNVVSVYEVGMQDDDFYIVSQFIDGLTLSEYHRSQPLSHEQIVAVLIKTLRAIHHFHERGIVHRDLKPGNILVNAELEPFVTDFGLARRDAPPGITITEDGKILGTIRYMAPEQAKGELSAVDRQTDVYGMGVVLYELLVGRSPFKAESHHTLLFNIIHQEVPPLRKIDTAIPVELETICLKALSKEKHQRYATAEEFAEDLQRYATGRPILAKPIGPLQRTIKWAKRNRRLTAALGVVLALSALSLVLWLRGGEPEIRSEIIPEGSVRVQISTTPAAKRIVFQQMDSATRMPMTDGETTCDDGEVIWLLPGMYRVFASDGEGRSHEVWRTVPQKGSEVSSEGSYLHTDFELQAGVFVLPQIRLFHRDDLVDPYISVTGGSFQMGYQPSPTSGAGIHQHAVGAFAVCPDEVSWARFRTVMGVKAHGGSQRTYLQILTQSFGDRSEEPGNAPVTGYPPDVAILYAELAGGRLPANFEYEYLLTTYRVDQQQDWPVPAPGWRLMAVDAETRDTTAAGVRNLTSSAAELTDSSMVAYNLCYPAFFAPTEQLAINPMIRGVATTTREVRGAPEWWINDSTDVAESDKLFDPRDRIPVTAIGANAAIQFQRIGWRLYRSVGTGPDD